MTAADETQRDQYRHPCRMTTEEKLKAIREMKAQLVSGEKRTLDAATL
jgi:hypothetical protein